MLRLDRIHPLVSGNKWFKLKYNLEAAGNKPIVTFGGAWSNHIHATAAACKMIGKPCTGIIRGERPQQLSTTLQDALQLGMQLMFVSREEYRNIKDGHADLKDILKSPGNTAYIIPEGGHNALGIKGCEEILSLTDTSSFTHIICAVGTGTTMAGLINSTQQQVIGISALKGAYSLNTEIEDMLNVIPPAHWQLLHDFHEGGFGRISPALIAFMQDFLGQTGIPLDRAYTGKMMYAVQQLLAKNFFPPGSHLLLLHSGGLQGNASLLGGS